MKRDKNSRAKTMPVSITDYFENFQNLKILYKFSVPNHTKDTAWILHNLNFDICNNTAISFYARF